MKTERDEMKIPLFAENLRKTYRDFWGRPRTEAVRGISLAVRPGEVVGLLGPNGSGKSTTIKMVLGLLRPDGGKVELFGLPPSEPAARRHVGYLPELPDQHRFLTPRETLAYHAGLMGLPSSGADARAEALLDRVGLARAAFDKPLSECSKGMARRAGLAAALLGDPQLVVLDEPTSGLDPVGRHEVKELICELSRDGKAVLLSSHLLSEVQDVCTRVAIMVAGLVRAEGNLSGLLERRDAVRFTVSGLPPEKEADCRAALGVASGGLDVAVDHPAATLEEYFLEVLRAAREEGGAEGGAAAVADGGGAR